MGILSKIRNPNQNQTEKSETETRPKITKVSNGFYISKSEKPKLNRTELETEPETERIPKYFKYIKNINFFSF